MRQRAIRAGFFTAAVCAAGLVAGVSPAPAGALTATDGIISTVAGGPGGPAQGTVVGLAPCGVAFSGRSLYVGGTADHAVRAVNSRTGLLTTIAGNGTSFRRPGLQGALATKAEVGSACGIAVDQGSGNVAISDGTFNRIEVLAGRAGTFYGQAMTAGHLYTVAGHGTRLGYRGDGGPALKARLNLPAGIAVDAQGNIVIADTYNGRIRVVAGQTGMFYGQAMTAGYIYTVAGGGRHGLGDGGPATRAGLAAPGGVSIDPAGNLVIADTNDNLLRVVAEQSGMFYGQAMTAGDIYSVAGGGTTLGDGGLATSANIGYVSSVAVDGAGNLVLTAANIAGNPASNRVRVVAQSTGMFYGQPMTAGDIYPIAGTGVAGYSGDGGPAAGAELSAPSGVVTDGSGNLVIADAGNDRVRVVAARTGRFYGQPMTAGDIYPIAGTGVAGYSGDGGPAASAELSAPSGVVTDSAGNLVIADTFNQRIRVTAGQSGAFYGQLMTAGHIYTVAGDGQRGFSGDGGPATAAGLDYPVATATDAAGNIVLVDRDNQRVRVVAGHTGVFYGMAMTAGNIYTVAGNGRARFSGDGGPGPSASLDYPSAVAVDGQGNIVIADTRSDRVRVVAQSSGTFYAQAMTAGDIYTVAGGGTQLGDDGPATAARLHYPAGVAVDGAGNIVLTDQAHERVRVVAQGNGTFYGQAMTAGSIYTVAGTGAAGYSGDGGPATSAKIDNPDGVTVDRAGNIVIADTGNQRIRVVAEQPGTFYGVAMTAGGIYTVAGTGYNSQPGYGALTGDGGPARKADLNLPTAVAVNGAGTLFIADSINNRIRQVTG